jgi:catechol 2,3-dioxygenase-like lactoylglutathione lyase family enzyme
MSQHPALTRGVHHVGLTVSELHETRDFFTGVLGFAASAPTTATRQCSCRMELRLSQSSARKFRLPSGQPI